MNFEQFALVLKHVDFAGGFSYTLEEMEVLFKILLDHYPPSQYPNIRVLEFGAGDSSIKLYKCLLYLYETAIYDIYENDPHYSINQQNITTHLYNINQIQAVQLTHTVYDLILVDGPTGVSRKYWYNKIRNNLRHGTILLIDDFNHYSEFGEELDKNFVYEELSLNDTPFVPNGQHSWKIVKIFHAK